MNCDCGKPALRSCWDVTGKQPLVACNKPLCGPGCTTHRHQPNTMGYIGWKGATQWKGDEPDGPGLWEWLKSRCRWLFWSNAKKAQRTWDEMKPHFPPPAPLPFLQLAVGGQKFESRGEEMVEVQEWSETPRWR